MPNHPIHCCGYVFQLDEKGSVPQDIITKIMFPDFPQDRQTDVGITPGAGIVSLPVVAKAAQLLANGQIGHLILSGGAIINDLPETKHFAPLLAGSRLPLPLDKETEADYMARFLKMSGVAEDRFTIENKSTNTGENFQSIFRLDAFKCARSVNIIGLLPTRALATMRRQELGETHNRINEFDLAKTAFFRKATWDEIIPVLEEILFPRAAVLTNVIPMPGITKENWAHNPTAAAFVTSEFSKLDPLNPENYVRKRFCLDISLDQETRRAHKLPAISTPLRPDQKNANSRPSAQGPEFA